jgi:hypothetical protein
VVFFSSSNQMAASFFKLGFEICERCLEEDESATHNLCDCEAIADLRFRHLGQIYVELSDYYDAPISLAFHSKCMINKGLIRRGSTIVH